MNIENLIILSLAAWRIASLIAEEYGPFLVFERIRFLLGVYYITITGEEVKTYKDFSCLSKLEKESLARIADTEIGKLITCAWCSSIWIAAILILLIIWFGQPMVWVYLPFAVSTGVIIVNRIING